MTRAERRARPNRSVAAKLRQSRIRIQQRAQGLCRVGSCTRVAINGKSCGECAKRGQYQCLSCGVRGHNSRRHGE